MKTFFNTGKGIMLGFALVASISYAWTNPKGPAPTENVATPINIGSSAQNKNGALGLNILSIFQQEQIDTSGSYVVPTNLLLGVNGSTGSKQYCDENGQNCFTSAQMVAAINSIASSTGNTGGNSHSDSGTVVGGGNLSVRVNYNSSDFQTDITRSCSDAWGVASCQDYSTPTCPSDTIYSDTLSGVPTAGYGPSTWSQVYNGTFSCTKK